MHVIESWEEVIKLLVLYGGIVLELFVVQIAHENGCLYNCRSIIQYISGNKNLSVTHVYIGTYK